VLHSFGYIPRSGIARSYGRSMFRFLRSLQIFFQSGCTSLHSHASLIFDKSAKNVRWRIDSIFNKCCWEKWLSACRKLKLHPCLSTCTSINLKWIKDLNIRPETLHLVQERAGNTLDTMGIGRTSSIEPQQPSN
jgi:hypothetical protein